MDPVERGTTAPEQTYPEIVEAPPSAPGSHPFHVKGDPAGAADQAYPELVPAPDPDRSRRCPFCKKPI